MYCCVFDRLDVSNDHGPLYLQGGWTCPARNTITRSKSMKISNCTRTLLGSVRPTGQTGWSCQTGYIRVDRSDRSLPILIVNTTQHGVLTSLPLTTTKYRTSLYADAAAIFMHPNQNELQAVKDILEMFGNNITGLVTNFEKRSIHPIRSENIDLDNILQPFPGGLSDLPNPVLSP